MRRERTKCARFKRDEKDDGYERRERKIAEMRGKRKKEEEKK